MSKYIHETRAWVDNFVVKLDLCPFASFAIDAKTVLFTEKISKDKYELLESFWNTLNTINLSSEYNSAILVIPQGLADFFDYLDFFDKAQMVLDESPMCSAFQLASFHPDYMFENSNHHDPSNYTNRSPYPLIHILSVSEVTEAIDKYGDTSKIPQENIKKLSELGINEILSLLSK